MTAIGPRSGILCAALIVVLTGCVDPTADSVDLRAPADRGGTTPRQGTVAPPAPGELAGRGAAGIDG